MVASPSGSVVRRRTAGGYQAPRRWSSIQARVAPGVAVSGSTLWSRHQVIQCQPSRRYASRVETLTLSPNHACWIVWGSQVNGPADASTVATVVMVQLRVDLANKSIVM